MHVDAESGSSTATESQQTQQQSPPSHRGQAPHASAPAAAKSGDGKSAPKRQAVSRVAIQLTPRNVPGQPDSLFIEQLKSHKKNLKLRIDNVRRTTDLSMVIDHCRKRWKDHLSVLDNPPLRLFLNNKQVDDYSITIDSLCNQSGVGSGPDSLQL